MTEKNEAKVLTPMELAGLEQKLVADLIEAVNGMDMQKSQMFIIFEAIATTTAMIIDQTMPHLTMAQKEDVAKSVAESTANRLKMAKEKPELKVAH